MAICGHINICLEYDSTSYMIRADILEVLIVDMPLALHSSYQADFSPSPLQVTIAILLLPSRSEVATKGNEVCTKSKTSFFAAAWNPPCTSSARRASLLPGLFKKIEQRGGVGGKVFNS